MHKKYKVILFDMDGTIVNSDEAIAEGFLELYKIFKAKKEKTKEELYYFSGPPINKTLENEFPGYDINLLLDTWHKVALEIYRKKLEIYEDELEVLNDLKNAGYRLGVVTNKISTSSYEAIKICHLDNLFETLICRDHVSSPKPHKEGIELALKNIGIIDKSEVIYVGDNEIDFNTASNAGVDAMLVTWGPREINRKIGAKYFVSSMKELRKVFIDD